MPNDEPEKLADELERAADQMQTRNDRLGQEVENIRADWQSKRSDPKVPGAPAPEGEERGEQEPPPEVGPPGQ